MAPPPDLQKGNMHFSIPEHVFHWLKNITSWLNRDNGLLNTCFPISSLLHVFEFPCRKLQKPWKITLCLIKNSKSTASKTKRKVTPRYSTLFLAVPWFGEEAHWLPWKLLAERSAAGRAEQPNTSSAQQHSVLSKPKRHDECARADVCKSYANTKINISLISKNVN